MEDWLGKVEDAMFVNLRKLMKISIHSFESSKREEWLRSHANQIILTVEQLMWSRDITLILEDPIIEDRVSGLGDYEKKCHGVSTFLSLDDGSYIEYCSLRL